MVDYTKPVRTIGTKEPAKIISLDGREPYSVLGYIGESVNIKSWTIDGLYLVEGGVSDFLNLENIPQKRSGWRNVYMRHGGNLVLGDALCDSQQEAKDIIAGHQFSSGRKYLYTAYIEWEE